MQNNCQQKSQLDAIPYISLHFYNWTIFGLAVPTFLVVSSECLEWVSLILWPRRVHPDEYILCVIIWNLLWSVGKCPRFGTVSLRLQTGQHSFSLYITRQEQGGSLYWIRQFYLSVLFSEQWVQREDGSLMCISATCCVLPGHTA